MSPAVLRFRFVLLIFITGLVLSGVTAFPLLSELRLLTRILGVGEATGPDGYSGLTRWILTIRWGLEDSYAKYPWIAYGTDWLAFGHIVIAMFFVPAFFHPESSRSTLLVGLVACISVIPLAFIAGPVRGIPVYWRLIDCCFGLGGLPLLLYALKLQGRIAGGR